MISVNSDTVRIEKWCETARESSLVCDPPNFPADRITDNVEFRLGFYQW